MTPYYEDDFVTLYHGDCRDLLPSIEADVVVTDPPYGMAWDGRISSGPNTTGIPGFRAKNYGQTIVGDDIPFDPEPWLTYPEVVLWGSNHYAAQLPLGTTLVWVKKLDGAFGTFLSDAEVAWAKGGHGVYCFRETDYRYGPRDHPNRKPVSLMAWCIKRTSGETILDPFAGSGTTLVAAKSLNRKAIGIEIEERYCEIAATRLRQEVLGLDTGVVSST